ncbi:MAG TPA: flagellar filament capping protein FliD [Steroidobacteraceae bacterium]|nr:flagellar filament capping protein FliD [Steroidobacteraceae bacterium]
MATLQSTGIGSGLDVNGLVTQLVNAEKTPKTQQITKQQTTVATQISAMGSLKGALGAFQSVLSPLKTPDAFNVRSATSSDEKVFTATASSSAPVGTYTVEVVQLAKAQQLASDAFDNSKATVGTGLLTIAVGSKHFTVNVADDKSTLEGIRDSINQAKDNVGVRAAIVQADDGAHLILTSNVTGADNQIKVTAADGDGGLAKLTYDAAGDTSNYTERSPAQDSEIKIAGYVHHSAKNVVTDAIDGVTLTLLKESDPDADPVKLNVDANIDAAIARIQNFVSQYNALATTVSGLQSYDASTQKAGPLLGDALLRSIDSDLKAGLVKPVEGTSGAYTTLASLGITTKKDGTLELDATKLRTALTSDFDGVGQVFGSENGIAARLDKLIAPRLASTGDIALRNKSLDDRSKALTKDLDTLNDRMTALQQRYMKQFSALDSLLSQMQTTSSYLSQQLANLPKIGS